MTAARGSTAPTEAQRRTLEELDAEIRSVDAFGTVHARDRLGRLVKIRHRDGWVYHFDTGGYRRPAWAAP